MNSRCILLCEGEGEGEGLGSTGEGLLFSRPQSSRALFRRRCVAMRMETTVGAACVGSGETCEQAYNFLGLWSQRTPGTHGDVYPLLRHLLRRTAHMPFQDV